MKLGYQDNIMIKVAWYYYMENMKQQQIAEQLQISRMKVVKLLEKARAQNIVQFKIRIDCADRMASEKKLLEKYNLKDIYVVPTTPNNINDTVSKAAAQYIEEHISDNSIINVGYGDTVSRTVNHLNVPPDSDISIVSLSGGVSCYITTHGKIQSMHSSRFHSKLFIVPAPLIASSKESAQSILEEPSVNEILNMTRLADMTVIGIGSVSEKATIFIDGKINHNDLTLLRMQGAVGDILSQFYDSNGSLVEASIHSRLVSTHIDALKDMKNVIGVAGGKNKASAILGALKGGYIDVLITDEDTLNAILDIE